MTAEDITAVGRINLAFWKPTEGARSPLKYDKLPDFTTEDVTANVTYCGKQPERPSWNGFMQMVSHGPHPGSSSVFFMPMIDLKSSDEICIFSTMCFVSEQAKLYNYTPILTFDQPLWWKSYEIQQSESSNRDIKDIILRLGGLHTEMSFLGAIGHLMGGSGLQELLEVIYADTAVSHILTGKAISRAIRGHILVEAVLYAIILSKIYRVPLPFKENNDARGDAPIEQISDNHESQDKDTSVEQPTTKHVLEYSVEEVVEHTDISGSQNPVLEYSVEDVLEQTLLRSESNSDMSRSDSGANSLSAENIIRNITAGDMEIYEEQLIEEENIDESLELLPEMLDKLTEAGTEYVEKIDNQTGADLNIIGELYDKLTKQEINIESACSNSVFQSVQDTLQKSKSNLSSSRTARLWFLYLDMIDILKQFIKAEREGNWSLHLHSMARMLPFFAASGHNLYTKSAYIYLQNMEKLSIYHPNVHRLFQEGYHVVRRSDRHWAGLSTDLVIEQMLMRSLKTYGGLTRGRGMTESQRTIWLLSVPACADISQAMEEFSNTTYVSSEQHKDSTKARISRDNNDMKSLAVFLEARNPFDSDPSLRSISSGVIADESVNVDNAKQIGESILKSMEGKMNLYFARRHRRSP